MKVSISYREAMAFHKKYSKITPDEFYQAWLCDTPMSEQGKEAVLEDWKKGSLSLLISIEDYDRIVNKK